MRQLKPLPEENPSAEGLKRLVADLTLDKGMLQDVLEKDSKTLAALHGLH